MNRHQQPALDPVQQGVSLALDAHRRGFVDDRALDAILAYYDAEGAVDPFPAADVLTRIGGVTDAQLRELFGQAPARTPSEIQGQRFGDRLTLLEPIGEGGMGTVYRAYDRVLKRVVAVKRVRVDHLDGASSGRVLARFEREAMAMARVRHPACVQIFDAGLTAKGEPYLVMEFVAGKSLRAVIEEQLGDPRRAVDARQVAAWGAAIAEALQACHDVGLVHRDVKPANVLLDAKRQPRLTDFGVALDDTARTKLTVDKAMVGTLTYMAPEQALGEAVDARSDVYALGATLYELLTGRPPFDASSALILMRQVLSVEPTPVRKRTPAVPVDFETIVMKCLSKAAGDRYATAQALALDLRRFMADEPVLARPVSAGQRLARRLWRARRALAAGLLVALGAAAVAGATHVRAREAQRARIDAALAAAAITSDLDAAEQEVLPLVAIAEPEQAERAREALRALRGRRRLREAEAAFERWKEATARAKALQEEADALEERIDPQQPYAESEDKKRRRQIEAEQAVTLERGARALFDTEGFLAQAALDLPSKAPELLRARLLVARGRAMEDDNPQAAERHFSEADRLVSDDELRRQLAAPTVTVVSQPPASCALSEFRFDLERGRMVPVEVARMEGPGRLVGRGAGDYLLEVAADGHLPARYLLQLTRGHQRRIEVQLIPRDRLGPLADVVVHVPGGEARWGDRLQRRAVTKDLLLFREEVSFELWWSYLVAVGKDRERLTITIPRAGAPKARGRRHWPVMSVTPDEVDAFVRWLQAELERAGISGTVRLPSPSEWFRALRGELAWLFPWGTRFDGAFCLNNAGVQPDDMTTDRLLSDERVEDVNYLGLASLAGGVREFVRDDRATATLGGSFASNEDEVVLGLSAAAYSHERARGLVSGLRLAVETSEEAASHVSDRSHVGSESRQQLENLIASGRLDAAWIDVEQLLTEDSADPAVWNFRGLIRCRRDDPWGGVWDYSVALGLAPDDPVILTNRAAAQLERGDLAAAERDIDKALEHGSQHPETWVTKALVLAEVGELEAARAALAHASALSPNHPALAAARRRIGR